MQAKNCHQVIYGVGDASGEGFGDSFLSKDGLSYHIGIWKEDTGNQSSNYREFRNFLVAFKREGEAGRLANSFVLFCTDNSTVEAALFKGTSSSKLLLEMVIEFHSLLMTYGCEAFISHVAETRMIAQGGDGLSRGALNEGVMRGEDFLSFIPFHLSAFEREPKLKEWVRGLVDTRDTKAIFLTPDDWFEKGHDIHGWTTRSDNHSVPIIRTGTYVWSPPPAACNVAIEELRKSRIKRQDSTHIFLVPRLMTPLWLKQLYKCCDLILEIPPSCEYWNTNMYEPCVIGFCFPFLSHFPWQLRSTPKMFALHRTLPQVWKDDKVSPRFILRKFLLASRRFPFMQDDVVRKMLYFTQGLEVPPATGPEDRKSKSHSKCKVEKQEACGK